MTGWFKNPDQVRSYFETLAASTDRMVLEQIGESTRGVPLYVAAISTPENLARVDRYKEITRTLAYARDPDGGYGTILAEDEARALAQEAITDRKVSRFSSCMASISRRLAPRRSLNARCTKVVTPWSFNSSSMGSDTFLR